MSRIPALQTFEIRPSPASRPVDERPDELRIDWGSLPLESTAEIYVPAASAAEILATADRWYSAHRLRQLDVHTVDLWQRARSSSVNLPLTRRPHQGTRRLACRTKEMPDDRGIRNVRIGGV